MMHLSFVPMRTFLGFKVVEPRCISSLAIRPWVNYRAFRASLSARERRQAAGRAREELHKSVKRDLEANPRDVVPTVVMVPSHVRERCSLTARMARVKVFLEPNDVSDVTIFRNRVRAGLVQFFPELEERGLLRTTDGFDLRVGGAIVSSDLSVLRQGIERFQNAGSPLYVEIIPHNTPPPKPPLSERVYLVQDASRRANDDPDLRLFMISFYKFVHIDKPAVVASILFKTWSWMGVKGRIYVAREGINAQLAVPEPLISDFKGAMNGLWVERDGPVIPKELHGVFLNVDRLVAREAQPFEKLNVRPRNKILADGLDKPLDWNNAGKEVDPQEWHKLLKEKSQDVVLLDCRNDYESDVGHFEGAKALNTKTFRETWDELEKLLSRESRDKPILTYCTGGIRCVKVNAFLEQKMGFKNTGRLAGGIVSYARTLRDQGQLENSMFKGVNHVFDGRMGEMITDDLLDGCVNCGQPCNVQTDCANVACPRPFDKRIFVQCEDCTAQLHGACCEDCSQALFATGVIPEPKTANQQDCHTNGRGITANEMYADAFSSKEEPLLVRLRRRTEEIFPNRSHIMSSHAQGLFLKLLAQIVCANRVLEIGTYTGYSALCLAAGMQDGGELVTCEIDDAAADVAQEFFDRRSNRSINIHVLRGDALNTLERLFEKTDAAPFDIAFIDADKGGYVNYVKCLLDSNGIRLGGLVVIDNVLFRGEVAAMWKEKNEESTAMNEDLGRKRLRNVQNVRKSAQKIHFFNQYLHREERLESVVLPFRDGVTVARRVR